MLEAGVVIVGSPVGGLSCGAVLAAAGIPTRILEPGEVVGEPYRTRRYPAYHFDGFPPLLWGLEAGATLAEALAPLALPPFKCHEPGLQVILPRHRLSFHADPERLALELTRECGIQAGGVQAFLADLDRLAAGVRAGRPLPPPLLPRPGVPRGPRLQRGLLPWFPPVRGALTPVADLLEQHGVGDVFGNLVAVLTAFWYAQSPASCPALALALLLKQLRGGLYLPTGGAQTLTDALVAAFLRAGGDLRTGTPVQALLTRFRRVTAVLTGTREAIPCATVLLTRDEVPPISRASDPAGDGPPPQATPPAGGAILHVAVDEAVLPPALGPCALAAPDGPKGSLCLLMLAPPGEPTRTPLGKRALTILFLPGPGETGAALAEAPSGRLLARLEPIFPGLSHFTHFTAVTPAPATPGEEAAENARLWWVRAIREPFGPLRGCLFLPRTGLLGRGLLSELCWGRYVAEQLLNQ